MEENRIRENESVEDVAEECVKSEEADNMELTRAERKRLEQRGIIKGVVLCFLVLALIGTGLCVYRMVCPSKEQKIWNYIKGSYLHEYDTQAVEDGKYTGMLDALDDKYSTYYTEADYTTEKDSNNGTYKGIGVIMQEDTEAGELVIVRCYDDSPGDKAGLLSGDVIVQVNEEVVTSENMAQMVEEIRQTSVDGVHLTIFRAEAEDLIEVDLVQEDVSVPYVEYKMMDDHIGYLAMYEFTATTADQFEKAMTDLKEQGMEKLVIDLRSNPGGLVTSVTKILESILPKGLIVYTEDKNGKKKEYTGAGETPLDIPLVVLVNQYSASASEIFAGAVKDYGIGTLVGVTTYGKGVVQSIISLGDGTGIKLTTANYYTPNGTNIDGTGIEPDVEVELDTSNGSVKQGDLESDNQLQKAIDILGQ